MESGMGSSTAHAISAAGEVCPHLVALRDLLRERESLRTERESLRTLLEDVQAAIDWWLDELRRSEGAA